jgi:hypothetical protein
MKTETLNLTNAEKMQMYSLTDNSRLAQIQKKREAFVKTLRKEKKQRDDYAKAHRIAAAIKCDGNVSPEDKKFLMKFDAFLYISSKIAAASEKKKDGAEFLIIVP